MIGVWKTISLAFNMKFCNPKSLRRLDWSLLLLGTKFNIFTGNRWQAILAASQSPATLKAHNDRLAVKFFQLPVVSNPPFARYYILYWPEHLSQNCPLKDISLWFGSNWLRLIWIYYCVVSRWSRWSPRYLVSVFTGKSCVISCYKWAVVVSCITLRELSRFCFVDFWSPFVVLFGE